MAEHEPAQVPAGDTAPRKESASDTSDPGAEKMDLVDVKTKERVDNPTYYEKDGLRTYGDGMDHDPQPFTFQKKMALVAQAFLWTGSQIPVYLFGGIPPYIYEDIGGSDRWVWFILANLLALAAVCPFVGSLSDILGRRYVAMMGATLIIIGMIICSTAHNMNVFIGGQVFAGAGAGINELTSLAVTSELAPTKSRGKYVAALVLTILPYCPSVMYGQLIASKSPGAWRWIGLWCAVWALIGLVLTAAFYFPPPRVNSQGLSKKETLKRIDYVGGLLSISGMILFMAGMQWGGYQYSWRSAHVLVPLLLGAALLAAFAVWEIFGAPHPMFPRRLGQDPRTLALTLLITFISGANFFSVLMLWPTQAYNVYGHDPVGVGLRGLPIGFSILVGATVTLFLLSILHGRNKELLIAASVLMTAGTGAMAVADVNNMSTVYGLLVIAGLGIGGIVVPASIMTTIICPDDLIATVAALTLAVRVIGGSIGYCIYFNVFYNKFVTNVTQQVGLMMVFDLHFSNITEVTEVCELLGNSLLNEVASIPGVANTPGAFDKIVAASQIAFADSYKWVYYVSLAFGGLSIIASCFLGDIRKYMDSHVAVQM